MLLETNLDNATGEQLGFAMERLFEAGALDVWHTPIQMKKNRPRHPAIRLGPGRPGEAGWREVFLRDTPTLGVRVRPVGRYVADRDIVTVDTEYGPMRVKRKWLGGRGGQRGAGVRGRGGGSADPQPTLANRRRRSGQQPSCDLNLPGCPHLRRHHSVAPTYSIPCPKA